MAAFSSRPHEVQLNVEKAKISLCVYISTHTQAYVCMPCAEISDVVEIVTFSRLLSQMST